MNNQKTDNIEIGDLVEIPPYTKLIERYGPNGAEDFYCSDPRYGIVEAMREYQLDDDDSFVFVEYTLLIGEKSVFYEYLGGGIPFRKI